MHGIGGRRPPKPPGGPHGRVEQRGHPPNELFDGLSLAGCGHPGQVAPGTMPQEAWGSTGST